MKKLVVLLLAITLFAGISLMGCSQETPPPPKEEAKPAAEAPKPAEPAKDAPAAPAPEKPAEPAKK
jgi:PBP1b-binding outer membrane lipoprotein LpoB